VTVIKGLFVLVGVLAVALIGLNVMGAWRWAGSTRALLARLESTRQAPAPARYDVRELEGLPPPVQRYFRAALRDGQALVAAARVEHSGRFNLGETTDRWKPFISRQRVVTQRPGFVWDGRVVMLPGLPVHVHDAYVAGEGLLHPSLFGLFTLVDLRGTREVAQGELMRFFAEAAWYPTALLPSQGVRWEPADERSARGTLVDGPLTLTMLFRFDERGLIESVRAEARGRTLGGAIVMTPWEGRWSDYQTHSGMLVPMTGEVAWLAPEGRKPYWRGTITQLHYEFAR
jgi:hypothetical protein